MRDRVWWGMTIKAKKKGKERSIKRGKKRRKNDLYGYTVSYNESITLFQGDEYQSWQHMVSLQNLLIFNISVLKWKGFLRQAIVICQWCFDKFLISLFIVIHITWLSICHSLDMAEDWHGTFSTQFPNPFKRYGGKESGKTDTCVHWLRPGKNNCIWHIYICIGVLYVPMYPAASVSAYCILQHTVEMLQRYIN